MKSTHPRRVTGDWSKEEADTIRALAPTHNAVQIAGRMNRTVRSIKLYAWSHGIPLLTSNFTQSQRLERWHKREDMKREVYRLRLEESLTWDQIAARIGKSRYLMQNLFDEACQEVSQNRPAELAAVQREQQAGISLIQEAFLPVVKRYRDSQDPEDFAPAVDAAKAYLNAFDRMAKLLGIGSVHRNNDVNVLLVQSSEQDLREFAEKLRSESQAVDSQIVDGEISQTASLPYHTDWEPLPDPPADEPAPHALSPVSPPADTATPDR